MIEVHPDPASALSDGPQSLRYDQFAGLMQRLAPLAAECGRPLALPEASGVRDAGLRVGTYAAERPQRADPLPRAG
jgi:hypothetical protein